MLEVYTFGNQTMIGKNQKNKYADIVSSCEYMMWTVLDCSPYTPSSIVLCILCVENMKCISARCSWLSANKYDTLLLRRFFLFISRLKITINYIFVCLFDRDHPSVVKKRFCSVTVVVLLSPIFIYLFLSRHITNSITIWEIMGLRFDGFLIAFSVPLLLTAILFLGPLSLQVHNGVWKSIIGMF